MYIDKRMIYILMGIFLLTTIGDMIATGEIISILLTLPGILIAITFHEFAHAFAADKLGDTTPRMQNRLNLNPLSHLDPLGTILLLKGFGWGKPVQINPRNFDRNISTAKGEAIVSVAGPLMNMILAIIFTIVNVLLSKFANVWVETTLIGAIVGLMVEATIFTNIGLGVFNLIPLPPLDGSKIFMSFMPYNVRNWILEKQHLFYIIFLIIWITPIASLIISPIIGNIANGMNWIFEWIFSFIK